MSISERINPDNLNIHQFQETPEGRLKLPFDVEKELPADFKAKVLESLKAEREKGNKYDTASTSIYFGLLAGAKILWPNENFDDGYFSDDIILNFLNAHIKDWEEGNPGQQFILGVAVDILTARPQFDINSIKARLLNMAEKHTREIIAGQDSVKYANLIYIIGLVKRLDQSKKLNIAEEDLLAMRKWLDTLSGTILVYNLQHLRYIDPNYHPKLTSDDWSQLCKEVSQPSSSISMKMLTAVTMKILSAHKIDIIGPGQIDIQMYPPDINASTPELPEQKKF